MAKEPRRLLRDAKLSCQLVAANALLAAAHKVERHKPLPNGQLAFLKDGADPNGEVFPASFALVGANGDGAAATGFGAQGIDLFATASGAHRAVGPALRLQKLTGLLFVRKEGQ